MSKAVELGQIKHSTSVYTASLGQRVSQELEWNLTVELKNVGVVTCHALINEQYSWRRTSLEGVNGSYTISNSSKLHNNSSSLRRDALIELIVEVTTADIFQATLAIHGLQDEVLTPFEAMVDDTLRSPAVLRRLEQGSWTGLEKHLLRLSRPWTESKFSLT